MPVHVHGKASLSYDFGPIPVALECLGLTVGHLHHCWRVILALSGGIAFRQFAITRTYMPTSPCARGQYIDFATSSKV